MNVYDIKGIEIREQYQQGKVAFKKKVRLTQFFKGWLIAVIPKQRNNHLVVSDKKNNKTQGKGGK